MKMSELPSTAWALCSPCLLPNDVMWAVSLCDVCVSTLSLLIIAPHPARAQTPDTLIDTVYILCSLTLCYSDNIIFCYHYTDTHIYSLHPAFCFSTLIIVHSSMIIHYICYNIILTECANELNMKKYKNNNNQTNCIIHMIQFGIKTVKCAQCCFLLHTIMSLSSTWMW